jgi:hypothetical protein
MKFFTLKSELKALVSEIRKTRKFVREGMSQGIPVWKEQVRLIDLKHEFRHKHIAYCVLRGRTREQIEAKVINKPNEEIIAKYIEQYKAEAVPNEAVCAS